MWNKAVIKTVVNLWRKTIWEDDKMLTIDSIKLAVDSLAKKYNLAKVDLFGSYANGNATDKSDADLMVMFKESRRNASRYRRHSKTA